MELQPKTKAQRYREQKALRAKVKDLIGRTIVEVDLHEQMFILDNGKRLIFINNDEYGVKFQFVQTGRPERKRNPETGALVCTACGKDMPQKTMFNACQECREAATA